MTAGRRRLIAIGCAAVAAIAVGTGRAAADVLPGCASGATAGRTVFTVGVSASGTPFVSTYVASAPAASGGVGCASPSPAATIGANGPGVAVYPPPVGPIVPGIPAMVNLLQVGPYLLTVPVNPALQLYQIAPGYYVVRSLDPAQNAIVVLPLPGVPAAPNTGPIPAVIH